MTNVADTYHLQHRGNTWYYHRRVPTDLVQLMGKPVIKRSLQTSSKTEAKRLRAVHDLATDAQFAKLRGSVKPDFKDGSRVSLELLVEYLREAVAPRSRLR